MARAMVTPSLITCGMPMPFSNTTLRPRGPIVTPTALASLSIPLSMRARASLSNVMFLASARHTSRPERPPLCCCFCEVEALRNPATFGAAVSMFIAGGML